MAIPEEKKIPQNLASSPFIFATKILCMYELHWIIFWGHQVVRTLLKKRGWFFYAMPTIDTTAIQLCYGITLLRIRKFFSLAVHW
jgi:hypothetical protein